MGRVFPAHELCKGSLDLKRRKSLTGDFVQAPLCVTRGTPRASTELAVASSRHRNIAFKRDESEGLVHKSHRQATGIPERGEWRGEKETGETGEFDRQVDASRKLKRLQAQLLHPDQDAHTESLRGGNHKQELDPPGPLSVRRR